MDILYKLRINLYGIDKESMVNTPEEDVDAFGKDLIKMVDDAIVAILNRNGK